MMQEMCGKAKKTVTIDGIATINNILDLPKVGAGHDGTVYRYGNLALKLLKYDIPTRKEKNLMTFTKVRYLRDEIEPKRFLSPYGLLLDEDGQYCGYSMEYVEDVTKNPSSVHFNKPSSFSTEELYRAIEDLERDTEEMTSKGIVMKDLNRGSYIYSSNLMRICDMDKFLIALRQSGIRQMNRTSLNFIIAKYFFYELEKKNQNDPNNIKILRAWTKNNIVTPSFISKTKSEIEGTSYSSIDEYLTEKMAKILK